MPSYPNLSDQPIVVQRAVKDIFDFAYQLKRQIDDIRKGSTVLAQHRPLTVQEVKQSLQSPNPTSLNVEGLLGVLAQPQKAGVPNVTVLPDVLTSQDGELCSYNQVVYRFDTSTEPGAWLPLGATGVILTDTRANRATYPAANYSVGTLYYESDTAWWYKCNSVGGVRTWQYVLGVRDVAQAGIAGLGLGVNDDSARINVTDYAHLLRWTWGGGPGSFGWDAGENGSGHITWFAIAPTGNGWKLADGTGSPVAYLKSDGTTATVTLPDLTTGAYPKGAAAYTGVVNAASAPTMSGTTSSDSAGTPSATFDALGSHSHELPFQLDNATPAISQIDVTTFGTGASRAAVGKVSTTADTTDAAVAKSEAISAGTPSATFNALVAHSHGVGSLAASATGEPKNIVLLPYFRK